eukprot:15479988-Alexandrium_andersonii.AAC.1
MGQATLSAARNLVSMETESAQDAAGSLKGTVGSLVVSNRCVFCVLRIASCGPPLAASWGPRFACALRRSSCELNIC